MQDIWKFELCVGSHVAQSIQQVQVSAGKKFEAYSLGHSEEMQEVLKAQ
jgi:hypothetical protein